MPGVGGHLGRVGRVALDLLLPPVCLTCDQPVAAPGQFCAGCFAATGFITEPCCHSCGDAFASRGGQSVCRHCLEAPPSWERARAALTYDAQARRLLLPLKYGDRVELAGALAGLMARAGARLLAEADVLVPVPLHRRRLRMRRYNQAALLAQHLGRIAGRAVAADALVRGRATVALGALSASERAEVVEGAFAVRPRQAGAVAGRRVLLVDDVLTSGATCGECARALLAGGAAAVDVLVAARVPDPRRRETLA